MDVGITINAPCDRVWSLLVDTTRWHEWGPSVTAVDCPRRYIQLGTRGRVRTPLGLWIPFQVTEFETGKSWSWKVAGIPATGHRVEPVTGGKCRLVFEIPLLAAPYGAVCHLAARKIATLCSKNPDEVS